MVENGLRPLNNRHHVAAVADALKVSVTDLTGQPYPANDRASAEAHSGLAVVRDTLVRRSLDFAEGTGARPVPVLRAEGAKIEKLAFDARYSEAVQLVPGILDELHEAFTSGNDRREAAEILVASLTSTSVVAHSCGHHALASIAVERARDVAEQMQGLGMFTIRLAGKTLGSRSK